MRELSAAIVLMTLVASAGAAVPPRLPQIDADVWRLQSREEAEAHFGPVDYYHWVGKIGNGAETIAIDIHLLDAQLTDYDLLQRRHFGESRMRRFAALLVLPEQAIQLIGESADDRCSLYDLELLMGEAAVEHDWREAVQAIKRRNQSAMPEAEQVIRIQTPTRRVFELHLGRALAPNLVEEQTVRVVAASKAEEAQTSAIRRCWIGDFRNDDEQAHDIRLETVEVKLDAGTGVSIQMIAVLSIRFRERRLEGSMPAGCPWPSRALFVHTLQDLTSADIDWVGGAFPDDLPPEN
jgi:hypothetical protein